MGILKDRFLTTLILLGLLVRLLLCILPGFKIDVDAWFAWAIRLQQIGFANFYSDQVFTIFAPGYLYILSFLGFLKSFLDLNSNSFYYVVKLPNIFSELILAIFVYNFLQKDSLKIAKLSAVAIIFNPGFLFNSSIWGQTDSTLALFLLLTVNFLKDQRLILSSIFLGLSFLVKPQAIAILSAFSLYTFKYFNFKNILRLSLPAILTIFLLSVPFFPQNPVLGLIHFIENSVNEYNGTSLFAYNFWGIFGFWVDDSQKFGPLSLQHWGYLLFSGYWLAVLYFYSHRRFSLLSLVTLATLSFYFLPTRVHERYLYSGLLFLILLSAHTKNKLLIYTTIALNIIYFLNLYYVYIYYNHFYFKIPSVLFWEPGYNLLNTSGKLLSLISTLCFIAATWLIVKTKPNKDAK